MYASSSLGSYNQQSTINTNKFLLSGPNPHQYWSHSPGAKQPLEREEGPFPIQGNIGMLVRQESGGFQSCNPHDKIGGSPNCSGSFAADYYTAYDACGSQCALSAPEMYGDKSFGLLDGHKVTNIHSLDSYENVRAASAGQSTNGAYGCGEWIPTYSHKGSNCLPGYNPPYAQVGNWLALSESRPIIMPGEQEDEPSAPVGAPVSH